MSKHDELRDDACNLLFALQAAWPYVHDSCTINSVKDSISDLLKKYGDFPENYVDDDVKGNLLPSVGQRVWILHGRDDEVHPCIVTGYYVWSSQQSKFLHRVFVRVVYEGTELTNSRLLADCFLTKEDAITQLQKEGRHD